MADSLNPVSASQLLQTAAWTLTPLSTNKPTPAGTLSKANIGLSAEIEAGFVAGSPASLDITDARAALEAATSAGRQILAALDSLSSAIAYAKTSSLVGDSVQLAVGGTRISRLNIQAEARQALREINRLVAGAEVGGVNLIASNGRAVQTQTTQFGGQIVLEPQPLDSKALGFGAPDLAELVSGFKAISDAEIERAGRQLALARETVSRRLQALTQARDRLSYSSAASLAVETLGAGQESLLPRGSVVNLIA